MSIKKSEKERKKKKKTLNLEEIRMLYTTLSINYSIYNRYHPLYVRYMGLLR
jgi:translation initiation factor IF-3